MLALRELQARFFRSIAGAPGPSASARFDPGLLHVLEGRGRLGAAERLDVYAQMYWARLHDVLRDDFRRVAALLGPERFEAGVLAYLSANPSEHPSVRWVGRHFAAFLAARPPVEGLPFVADLARLEWARVEVFDAPDAEPMRADDLRRIAPADWPDLRIELIPALQVLQSAWPVHAIWTTTEAGELPAAMPEVETHVRVWRDGFMIYQASMDASECAALERVAEGEPFAAMCDALVPLVGPERAAGEAAQIVLRWIEDGIVARSPLE